MGNSRVTDEYITERVDEKTNELKKLLLHFLKLQEFFPRQDEVMMVQILMVLVSYNLLLHYSLVKNGNVRLLTMSSSMR